MPTEVVQRAQQGDGSAFSEIAGRFESRIHGKLRNLIRRRDDVDDVAQEVLLRLHLTLPQVRYPEYLDSWIYRLTVNVAYDYLRKQRRHREVAMTDVAEEQLKAVEAAASEESRCAAQMHENLCERMNFLLRLISPQDRELLLLREVEGLTLKELGRRLECNPNTAGVRLFRARRRLQEACGHGSSALHAAPLSPGTHRAAVA